jgi:hypothetical protein
MIPRDFPSLLGFCDGQSARSVHNRAPVTAPGGLPLFRVCKLSVPKESWSGRVDLNRWMESLRTTAVHPRDWFCTNVAVS